MPVPGELMLMFEGLWRSLAVSFVAIGMGILIGAVLGALRYARIPLLNSLIGGYVNFFRCTPVIVQIFFVYNALPEVGIRLDAFQSGCVALALWGGAYYVEIFRASYAAVPVHDVMAARALGMPSVRTFLDINVPIAGRTALPAVTTTALTQFRSSSFLVAIGYMELTFVANKITSETFDVFGVFGVAALMYLAVCTLISYAARLLERVIAIPGVGSVRV